MSMNKISVLKALSIASMLSILILFVLRQAFGLADPLASKLMLIAVLATIASATSLGVAGYRRSRQHYPNVSE
ncbi:hypothetical protein ACX9MK_01935 [Corynebacterium evansiae]